eukprot:364599-Chlamydomonas_euryale.AAC.17
MSVRRMCPLLRGAQWDGPNLPLFATPAVAFQTGRPGTWHGRPRGTHVSLAALGPGERTSTMSKRRHAEDEDEAPFKAGDCVPAAAMPDRGVWEVLAASNIGSKAVPDSVNKTMPSLPLAISEGQLTDVEALRGVLLADETRRHVSFSSRQRHRQPKVATQGAHHRAQRTVREVIKIRIHRCIPRWEGRGVTIAAAPSTHAPIPAC